MTAPRESRLQAAARHGTRRMEERPAPEVSGRTRVSCDLTRENYLRLHMAAAEFGMSKIAILNALTRLLDDESVRARILAEKWSQLTAGAQVKDLSVSGGLVAQGPASRLA